MGNGWGHGGTVLVGTAEVAIPEEGKLVVGVPGHDPPVQGLGACQAGGTVPDLVVEEFPGGGSGCVNGRWEGKGVGEGGRAELVVGDGIVVPLVLWRTG